MFRQLVNVCKSRLALCQYKLLGRVPWSRGYHLYKFNYIREALAKPGIQCAFHKCEYLPRHYGVGLDERVVEYPWALARLSNSPGRLLDAGSCFNYDEILSNEAIRKKELTIVTLAPESRAYWRRGISYDYGDLRRLPYQDGWFDEICSISTLGHVGMDNSMYTKSEAGDKCMLEANRAAGELLRVLKQGGKLIISVVFGRRQEIEWNGTLYALQFDSSMLNDLMTVFSGCSSSSVAFYKYDREGWNISSEMACNECDYFNIHTSRLIDDDHAAAARAVAMIEVVK